MTTHPSRIILVPCCQRTDPVQTWARWIPIGSAVIGLIRLLLQLL